MSDVATVVFPTEKIEVVPTPEKPMHIEKIPVPISKKSKRIILKRITGHAKCVAEAYKRMDERSRAIASMKMMEPFE